ncbi:IRR1 [Candida pseudojiufengensis]|uniref:IRR1 n=1 Tax=Candida pseudojiufengensis TaxID=497109 RepID=UPI0022245020|nr:IRR1 [Candida pseudojiufengensis]KAI5962158.1 IRR1 [Candida pseudojiufengensis]
MVVTRSKRTRKEVSYKDVSDAEDGSTSPSTETNRVEQVAATPTATTTTTPAKTKTKTKTNTNNKNKRRKVQPSTLEEDFEENPLFLACSNEEVNIYDLAQEWIESYEEETLPNLKNFTNLMNLILRSCGSLHLFQPHDLLNLDSSEQTIEEITMIFSNQSTHKFAFKLVPIFKKNVIELFKKIIEISHERGILYGTDELMNYLITWITNLTKSSIRSLRYTSTEIALVILLQFSTISQSIDKNLERSKQHLIKNKQKSRAKTIQNTIDNFEDHIQKLDEYFDDLSEVIGSRYKDVDPSIRSIVVKNLIEAMIEYPSYFCQSGYLKYCGWLLSDTNNNVRKEITKNLAKLFRSSHSKEESVQNLTPFTQKFKLLLINMSQIDNDAQVRLNCYTILIDTMKLNLLDDENKIQIVTGFPFESKSSKEITEAIKFLKLYIDQENDSVLENSIVLDSNQFKLDEIELKELIKIKTLISVLKPISDKDLNIIFKEMNDVTDVKYMVKYLLADIDTITATTNEEDEEVSNEDIETAKKLIELTENEKLLILKLINSTFQQNPTFIINNLPNLQKFISKSKERSRVFIELYPLITSCFKSFSTEHIDKYIEILNKDIEDLIQLEENTDLDNDEKEKDYLKLISNYLDFKIIASVFVSYMNIPFLIQRQLLKLFIIKEKQLAKYLKIKLNSGVDIVGVDRADEDEEEEEENQEETNTSNIDQDNDDDNEEIVEDEENQSQDTGENINESNKDNNPLEIETKQKMWELEKQLALYYMKLIESKNLLDEEIIERLNRNIELFDTLKLIKNKIGQ